MLFESTATETDLQVVAWFSMIVRGQPGRFIAEPPGEPLAQHHAAHAATGL